MGAAVLVVDDEPTIAEIVARYLERAGYSARIAADGAQALALCAQSMPDLVVLDVMLPGIDGLEVLRRLREDSRAARGGAEGSANAADGSADAGGEADGGEIPRVILLTARGRETERIVGLRRGADDYIVKPFSPAELVARVEAVLRRGGTHGERGGHAGPDGGRPGGRAEGDARRGGTGSYRPEPAIELGGLRIEPATRRVTVRGREVALTAREFDLLAFLARHPGQVFSRDRLMELVWQLPDYSDSSTVTVHVRRLRAKLEPDPERPRYVQTVWGVGYRVQP